METQRWTLDRAGVDGLRLEQASVASPGPGQVVVEVAAVSLNYRDMLVINGAFAQPLERPFSPASDMAGRIVATGPGATRFKVGERVMSTYVAGWIDGRPIGSAAEPYGLSTGGPRPGMLARHVVIDQDWLVRSPESLDDAETSTLPIAGVTAWYALVELGKLRAGQTVLVQGTGGVALFGLQIAKAHGARVIVTSGEDCKLAKAKALGADHVINRRSGDWVEGVLAATKGYGADHVLEIVGGANLGRSVQSTAAAGRISLIGVIEGFDASFPVGPLLMNNILIQGIYVAPRRATEDFVRAVDALSLKPQIDRIYPFTELRAALEHLQRGAFGKVVVRLID